MRPPDVNHIGGGSDEPPYTSGHPSEENFLVEGHGRGTGGLQILFDRFVDGKPCHRVGHLRKQGSQILLLSRFMRYT